MGTKLSLCVCIKLDLRRFSSWFYGGMWALIVSCRSFLFKITTSPDGSSVDTVELKIFSVKCSIDGKTL